MKMSSSKSIKAINKDAVHRICSGQVVLNLAVAVKELVENSLDAGATLVDVRLKEYGSELIEVTDNGSGVEPANFPGLTLKHHTSKLQDFSDLVSVETFGFRGEALSSLCSLSDLTVTTRHSSSDCGTRLQYDHNGQIISSTSVARQVGTTVCLENIFSTLPVRHKEFLRHMKREFGKMTQLLYAYCLVSTGVKITCTNYTKKGGKMTVVATQGCKAVRENIACVFGTKQLASLLELKTVAPSEEMLEQFNLKKIELNVNEVFQLEGLISSCAHGLGRSSNDRQFYYINSRPCEPTKVMKAVNEVFHQYNFHQHPFVFLNVSSSRDSVDVNVTPDKRTVFLEHEKLLLATVKASLQALYENIPSTYTVNTLQPMARKIVSPQKTSSPQNSPAFLLSQYRHASAGKRPSMDQTIQKLPKQAKLDSIFARGTLKVDDCVKESLITLRPSGKSSPNSNITITSNNANNNIGPEISSPTEISEHSQNDCNKELEVLCSNKTDSLENALSQESIFIDITEPQSDNNQLDSAKNSSAHDVESDISSQSSELTPSSSIIENIPNKTADSEIYIDKLLSSPFEGKSCVKKGNNNLSIECDLPAETGAHRSGIEVDVSMEKLTERFRQSEAGSSTGEKIVRFRAVIDPSKNNQAEQELSRNISKDMFAKMEVVGQFNLGFIITKLGSDLFIVDQHATDEKYNFETLQRTETISSQKLVV